eukprot:3716062-Pyramimonas_sp.AAC.1
MVLNAIDVLEEYEHRATDRVESSGFNRRTRLRILSAVGVLTSTVATLQLELCRKYRQRISS